MRAIRPPIPPSVAEELFDKRGVDVAILHPMTRGIMPDRHLGTAIAAAHNEMLVTRWLDHDEFGERFRGTIRVNPDDIAGALREIDKYKNHPGSCRSGYRCSRASCSENPSSGRYGRPRSDANLPVAAHIEVGSGIAAAPTPSGNTLTYEQYLSFMALNYLYHVMNMIAEGVFERMPTLKFVWADGAADMLTPFIWRMDCFWPPAPRADAVGAEDAERLSARSRLLRPGQSRRSR